MRTVPQTNLARIEFYEAHIEPWAADPAAIGLTPDSVAALETRIAAARAAYDAHQAAQFAAAAAALDYRLKAEALHADPGAGADMIQSIKNFAQSTDDPNVYVRASLPAPPVPGRVPAPGTPYAFRFTLHQTGELTLTWKCKNPAAGTTYEIRRSVQGCHAFTFLATSGRRRFTDRTLPAGSAMAVYDVTALRSTARGRPARFIVNLGVAAIDAARALAA